MSIRKKRDLSRLVVLDMTPSEAVILQGLIGGAILNVARHTAKGDALDLSAIEIGNDVIMRIRQQLDALLWPQAEPKKKAPFPV